MYNYNAQYFKSCNVALRLFCLDAVIESCMKIKAEKRNPSIASIYLFFSRKWLHVFEIILIMDLVECPIGCCGFVPCSG